MHRINYKSQISIFIIIGMVVLFFIGFLIVMNKTINKKYEPNYLKYDNELNSKIIDLNVKNCIRNIIEENLDVGFYNLEYEISNKLPRCISNFDLKQYKYSYSQAQTKIIYSEDLNTIYVDVFFPIEMKNENSIKTIKNFNIEFPLKRELELPENGIILKNTTIMSIDGKVKLNIKQGTEITNSNGEKIDNIAIKVIDNSDTIYQNTFDKVSYAIIPNNLTFSKEIELIMNYENDYTKNKLLAKNINLFSFLTNPVPDITISNEDDFSIVNLINPGIIIPGISEVEIILKSKINKEKKSVSTNISKSGNYAIAFDYTTIHNLEKVYNTISENDKNLLNEIEYINLTTKAYLPTDGEISMHLFKKENINLFTTHDDVKNKLMDLNDYNYKGIIAKLYEGKKQGTVPLYKLTHISGNNVYITNSNDIIESKKYTLKILKEILKNYNQESKANELLLELDLNGNFIEKLKELTNNKINSHVDLLNSFPSINILENDFYPFIYDGLQGYVYENTHGNSVPFYNAHFDHNLIYYKFEDHLYVNSDIIKYENSDDANNLVTAMITNIPSTTISDDGTSKTIIEYSKVEISFQPEEKLEYSHHTNSHENSNVQKINAQQVAEKMAQSAIDIGEKLYSGYVTLTVTSDKINDLVVKSQEVGHEVSSFLGKVEKGFKDLDDKINPSPNIGGFFEGLSKNTESLFGSYRSLCGSLNPSNEPDYQGNYGGGDGGGDGTSDRDIGSDAPEDGDGGDAFGSGD